MDPPRGHKPFQQTCSSMGSSLHRSTGPARSLIQHELPTGSQPPSGIHLLWHGVLHRVQVDIWSTMDLHGLQGDSLSHHGLLHKQLGNLCSSAWSTSSPPSSLTLMPAEFSLLSPAANVMQASFFLLKCVLTEVLLL